MRKSNLYACVLSTLAGVTWLMAAHAMADTPAPVKPSFSEDGTVQVPAFELPMSSFSSPEAHKAQAFRAKMPDVMPVMEPDIIKSRQGLAQKLAPQVARLRETYPVTVEESTIAGVPVRIVLPADKKPDAERVLINLHGGAFNTCWESCSLIESVPVASLGGFKVVSVNYRMAPEHQHPAGVEDVAQVYKTLLKHYRPEQIGVYGCSAGGALTAQTAAWLPANNLPQAGAVGIFGAGGVRFEAGDSAYIAGYIDGSFPPPATDGSRAIDMTRGYFAGWDMQDKSISPALYQNVLREFPPALIITGTRAMDMSPAIVTNSNLLKAGVESTLIVGEAMGHCYLYQAGLPEAQDAYGVMVNFFRKHLH